MNLKKLAFATFALGSSGLAFSQFEILATETAMGSISNPLDWKGIQRYGFANNGAAAITLSGISAGAVADPAGLFFANGELFVGNRHGNSNASSVSRFTFDQGTDSFSANGAITGNGLFGVHGVSIRPSTNNLYAANVNNGISSFTITPGGATANGMLATGAIRDTMFSADGANMYYTAGINGNLVRYNFATATFNTYSIGGASGLHFGNWRGNDLYVSDFGTGQVFSIQFDSNGAVVGSSSIASSAGAIGVAFSPDNMEMFVSSHTSNNIKRYMYNNGTSSWDFQSTIATGTNMGDIQVIAVPEPASIVVLGIGALAMLRRRKK